ncbi:MAG: sulfotransferase domain-containing protein [Oscillatoriales cyanobacterium SM2_1_8]|nr:sulfotransferase domain-containing protein [Oscillatoriales cyanobacterium SM2_1_8]
MAPFCPDFWIVGTQKGGTTALAAFLAAHPQIGMAPRKEVHFFDYDRAYWAPQGAPNYPAYGEAFPLRPPGGLLGEATPIYMYFPWIAPRLRACNPAAKLIAILRQPGDRAYSQYQMERQRGWETWPFGWAIRLESLRLGLTIDRRAQSERSPLRVHSYVERGFYHRQLVNLLRHFPAAQLLVLRNEELQNDHAGTLRRVAEFLEICPDVDWPAPRPILKGEYEPMDPGDRRYLQRIFAPEIDRLATLLNQDLSPWR